MKYIDAPLPKAPDKVVVAMSGGVDSTLSTCLLLEAGVKVVGATMRLSNGAMAGLSKAYGAGGACYSATHSNDIDECRAFCENLGIEYHVVDLGDDFKTKVVDYTTKTYLAGATPNPCITCNENIKFGSFIEKLKREGIEFDYFCTGHYARVVKSLEGGYFVACGVDDTKDQTYFLSRLPSVLLEKVRFPLGSFTKAEVYNMARQRGLFAADKAESQDFATGAYFDKLFEGLSKGVGKIIDEDGTVVGHHNGLEHYTIGKRRGTGVALKYPVYVKSIDAKENTLTIAPKERLFSTSVIAGNFVWGGGKVAGKEALAFSNTPTFERKDEKKIATDKMEQRATDRKGIALNEESKEVNNTNVALTEKDALTHIANEETFDKAFTNAKIITLPLKAKVKVRLASPAVECTVRMAKKGDSEEEQRPFKKVAEKDFKAKDACNSDKTKPPLTKVAIDGEEKKDTAKDKGDFCAETFKCDEKKTLDGAAENDFTKTAFKSDEQKASESEDFLAFDAGESYCIEFSKPQLAVAKGQSAVLYDEEGVVIGSGIILEVL